MMAQEAQYDDLFYDNGKFYLDGQIFTGVGIQRNGNGVKISEVPFVEGCEHGLGQSWYNNGALKGCTPYRHGIIHGVRRRWFADGSVQSEEVFEYGWLMKKEVRNENQQIVESYDRPASDPKYQEIVKLRSQEIGR